MRPLGILWVFGLCVGWAFCCGRVPIRSFTPPVVRNHPPHAVVPYSIPRMLNIPPMRVPYRPWEVPQGGALLPLGFNPAQLPKRARGKPSDTGEDETSYSFHGAGNFGELGQTGTGKCSDCASADYNVRGICCLSHQVCCKPPGQT